MTEVDLRFRTHRRIVETHRRLSLAPSELLLGRIGAASCTRRRCRIPTRRLPIHNAVARDPARALPG